MKHIFLIVSLAVIMSSLGCRKARENRLFLLPLESFNFTVPAGYTSHQALVFEYNFVSTHIEEILATTGVDTSLVGGIYPYTAKLESLDGGEYYYIQDMEVRICSPFDDQCKPSFDAVFSIDDLNGTADEEITLFPGLQNKREQLLKENVKIEVIMFLGFGQITPYAVDSRLKLTFEATE